MAYTSPELVRRHIDTLRVGELPVIGIRVALNGSQAVQLPHHGLSEKSVIVKARRSQALSSETVVLNDDWLSLAHSSLVEDVIVVAEDSSLAKVYSENIDILIDSQNGRLRRIPAGSIAVGQQVYVLYDHYFVYTQDDDFVVDVTNGTLSRVSTGAIADGQTVAVDYSVSAGSIPDRTIDQAINDAADLVLTIVDPRYHNQLLPGLVIGETHLAVAAACRMQALTLLGDTVGQGTAVREAVRVWIELAQSYDASGHERLARYAAPVPGLQSARRG